MELRDNSTVSYTHNTVNQYTDIGNSTPDPEYDDNGNLTRDHRGYEYQYDIDNRLTYVYNDVNTDGDYDSGTDTLYAQYEYGAMGRRIYSKIDAVEKKYIYDGQRVIIETDGSGTFQQRYVFGNYIDEVLIIDDGTDDYYYGHDHLYSPVVLFGYNSQQAVWEPVERYEYNAYGKVHIMDSSYNSRTTSSHGNPYTFTGRRLDELDSDALELMHYRARTYDPDTGSFLQNDPLGYIDSMNMHQYVSSNPVMLVDPYGYKKTEYPWGEEEWSVEDCDDYCYWASVTNFGVLQMPQYNACRRACRAYDVGMVAGSEDDYSFDPMTDCNKVHEKIEDLSCRLAEWIKGEKEEETVLPKPAPQPKPTPPPKKKPPIIPVIPIKFPTYPLPEITIPTFLPGQPDIKLPEDDIHEIPFPIKIEIPPIIIGILPIKQPYKEETYSDCTKRVEAWHQEKRAECVKNPKGCGWTPKELRAEKFRLLLACRTLKD